ncbi:Uncharacterised protein [Klebsiella pneumoniae]|nr:Uncharacterised protein [Klebsiella pneumoniae]
MRTFEVLFALHLLQTRETALELKLQPLALVNVVQRHCRADHQLYMALVELIHQSDKAAGLALQLRGHHRHVEQHHRMEQSGERDIVMLAARIHA